MIDKEINRNRNKSLIKSNEETLRIRLEDKFINLKLMSDTDLKARRLKLQ